MASPSRVEVLSLFRSLLKTAREFPDYNIREYTKRRTIDGFRQNKELSEPSKVAAAFSGGRAQLEVAKRQAVVYSLYAPKVKSVMELNQTKNNVQKDGWATVSREYELLVDAILCRAPIFIPTPCVLG